LIDPKEANGATPMGTEPPQNEFERASAGAEPSLVAELWSFLAANKKLWMIPILGALLLLGALIALSSTAVAPFIYTLF
jgi:hypothetical protein